MNGFHINKRIFVIIFALFGVGLLVYIGMGIQRGERHWGLAFYCAILCLYQSHVIECMTDEQWREIPKQKNDMADVIMDSYDYFDPE